MISSGDRPDHGCLAQRGWVRGLEAGGRGGRGVVATNLAPAAGHVALTFDDGPGHSTTAFLDLLDEYAVKATFFLLGEHIVDHVDVVRRMHAAGHEVAVHGWDHRCLAARVPRGDLIRDLSPTIRTVQQVTGQPPRRYRRTAS